MNKDIDNFIKNFDIVCKDDNYNNLLNILFNKKM